jgi:hypothetical protein
VYYFVPCSFEEAVTVFNQCKGRSVTSLPQYAVDAHAFADVPQSG